MARKVFPIERAKKKPPRRIDRPVADKLPLRAHPRLVHGFLVRLAGKSIIATPGAKRTSIATASVKAAKERPSDPKHEGPADDATFH